MRRTSRAHRLVIALSMAMLASVPIPAAAQEGNADDAAVRAHYEAVQQRMLAAPEIMRDLDTLRDNPAVKAVLADPAIAAALERGDLSALLADPKIRDLAEDPAVQSITREVTK